MGADRYPVDLFVEVDRVMPYIEGQARARIVARVGNPNTYVQLPGGGTAPAKSHEQTLFSEVVYDYPEEGRAAEKLIMLLFGERIRRLVEDE